jgi:hypothetical protein
MLLGANVPQRSEAAPSSNPSGHSLFHSTVGPARFERRPTLSECVVEMVGRRGDAPLSHTTFDRLQKGISPSSNPRVILSLSALADTLCGPELAGN